MRYGKRKGNEIWRNPSCGESGGWQLLFDMCRETGAAGTRLKCTEEGERAQRQEKDRKEVRQMASENFLKHFLLPRGVGFCCERYLSEMSSQCGLRTHICSALGVFAGPASALWPTVPLDGRQDEIMEIRDKDDKAEMAAVLFEGRAQSGPDKQIRNDICLLGLITTSMPVKLTERGWTDYVNIQRHIVLAKKRIDRACLSETHPQPE
ncbi:hypothetical protein Q8A67_021923 [Cirrhinus molitorella]|uniref:Uncharacterized protein n=1 Tax=Cirrhinus molitorella TaxID=172907 RepID=A0AA88P4E4_9TELE|nr:hypothetical protein Q8A67_021923 [Cirrhinus molitorella]